MNSRDPAPPRRPRATAMVCVVALLLQAILPLAHRAGHAWSSRSARDHGTVHVAHTRSGLGHDDGAAGCAVCHMLNASRNVLAEAPPGPGPQPLRCIDQVRLDAGIDVVVVHDHQHDARGPPQPALVRLARC